MYTKWVNAWNKEYNNRQQFWTTGAISLLLL
jgi:hypothetical protein